MRQRKQVLCAYDDHPREICPIVLGHTNGKEVALVYQFGGSGKTRLPWQGQWKCLYLSKASDVRLRDGAWITGLAHRRPQACVEVVDFDVNPDSPYNPRRRLEP